MWYDKWVIERGKDFSPIVSEEFKSSFIDQFFPLKLREVKILEFINLHQGNMSVREYACKFTLLSRYTPFMVVDLSPRMRHISIYDPCESN